MEDKIKRQILEKNGFKLFIRSEFKFKYPFFSINVYAIKTFSGDLSGDCTVKVNLKNNSVSFYDYTPSLTKKLISAYEVQKNSLDYSYRDYVNIHVNPSFEQVHLPKCSEKPADGWRVFLVNKNWFDNILREVNCCL